MTEFFSGNARGVLVGTTVHVIKGQSSFALFVEGTRYGYCCQDGCHDSGLRDDVRKVVAKAKEAGATHVMLRTGQRSYLVEQIEGLPVLDVTCHVGVIDETAEIARRYGDAGLPAGVELECAFHGSAGQSFGAFKEGDGIGRLLEHGLNNPAVDRIILNH